jgi:nucleoside-diphosphate-sugar epimerase
MPADALLVGCGRLGSAVGLRLADLGHQVAAIRRDASAVPRPLLGVGADLTVGPPDLPPLDLTYLVVALTARPRSEEAYRATYVDGMARALDAVEAAGQHPERAVLVSSSAVFGDVPATVRADESLLAAPTDGPGRMLLAAEELFAARLPGGTVLRLSGLYDGTSTRLVEQVRSGSVSDPHRWTNRIHRDDAAAAVVHLLTMPRRPDGLYVGTDDESVQMGDVAAHLADRIGAAAPPAADPTLGIGKRLSNARLRSTGWSPTYPTFREGYAEVTGRP